MGRAEDEACCGQEQSSAGKEVLARGLHKFPMGQAHQVGGRANLFAEPEWTVLETQQHPFCIHSCSVSNPVLYPLQKSHVHRMFSKMGSS